ncbi:glycosyltransferase family 4 protein [uncultured Pseudokineococcus sp.]|uniref:glycosyltransferase family 4 protein n=1 Tax=uncultured Pseudokineococcus sp. TaxID=1642928 RepID=UPI0026097A8D|nr:glycosyltransferase family 4 protein [uncultured Pseudokineococcus sp.]
MRITHVVATDQFAGLERYVVDVAGEQSRRGDDVVVVGGLGDVVRPLLSGTGARHVPGAGLGDVVRALRSGGRRDVVHSHLTRADYAALLAAPTTRGRRVSTRHITAPRGHGRGARAVAPLVRRALAVEVAVSAWTSEQLERPSDVVLLNGVREQPDVTAPRARTVVMAHRLVPEKDTPTGLRAWAASGLADRGWRLVVAGAGEDRADLERLSRSLGGAGAVEFTGWHPDPGALFREASALLAPAPTEPCGLTVLEAMALGTPVVAAGAAGHLETVGQHPGAALFPPGDHEAAAAHLRRLADDDDARRAYGDELRDLQRRELSLDVHVDRLQRVYEDALAGGRGR